MSLYKACKEILENGISTHTIGNSDISIETFKSLSDYNTNAVSTNQENIVLIKSDNITIDASQTLTPISPKKSLVLFCDTLINNGIISMTGKGPNVLPHDYYILYEDTIFEDVVIPAYANNRIERRAVAGQMIDTGIDGNNGTNRQCGSGGQGAATASRYADENKRIGASGSGYAFGGGAGGGGKAGDENTTYESDVDVDIVRPMQGAPGYTYTYYGATGGVGRPAGTDSYTSYVQYSGCYGPLEVQNIGVGGRIIIFCNNFINNGTIEAKGVDAKIGNLYHSASGGASGGGAIDIFYFGSYNQGNINVDGGASGNLSANAAGWAGADYAIYNGGKGGDGSVTVSQLNHEINLDGGIANNNLYTFKYTGKTEAIDLVPGVYNFYCKGAQGGGPDGTLGSIAKATIAILEPKTFYVSVGQSPLGTVGGWNGGRNFPEPAYGGGGSTDIAVQGIDQSTDWYTTLHLNSRIIMASGGNAKYTKQITTTVQRNASYTSSYAVSVYAFTAAVSGTLSYYSHSQSNGYPRGYVRDVTTETQTSAYMNNGTGFSISTNIIAGHTYELRVVGETSGGASYFSISYTDLIQVIDPVDTSKNYIYTQDTKDSYPENPCNAGNYYMTKPEIILDAPNIVKDGLAYIKRIGKFIFGHPYLKDIYYYYTGSEQTALIEQIEEDKVNIANNKKINAGLYDISITPKIGYYWTSGTNSELKLQWRILKADPEVTWPTPTMLDIDSQINKSRLLKGVGNGEFAWSDGSLKMKYPNSGYEAVFTPLDLSNYNVIKKKLSIRAIFLRNNSNLHKDSQQQDFIDFNKILDLMEVNQ